MTLAQLDYFVRVAETGHLTQTAEELMIAQPSLTQAIRRLEEEMGFPLFERSGRRIILTREGSEFLTYARAVAVASAKAKQIAKQLSLDKKGRIRFAHTEPLPRDLIPDLIFGFLQKNENRGIRIESDVMGSAKIFHALRNDEIDFGLCALTTEDTEDLTIIPLFHTPIVLIVPQAGPLSALNSIEPEELIRHPCVSYGSKSAMYQQIQSYWNQMGMHPDVRYRTSAVSIGRFVARSLGWAFVAMNDELLDKSISVISMPKLNLVRTTCLVMRSNRKHGQAAERFLSYVLSQREPDSGKPAP